MTEAYVLVPLAALKDAEKMALASQDYATGHHVASIIAHAVPLPSGEDGLGDDWPLEQEVFQAYNTVAGEPSFYTAVLGKLWKAYCALEDRLAHPVSAALAVRAQTQIDLGRMTGADGGRQNPSNIYVIAAALLDLLAPVQGAEFAGAEDFDWVIDQHIGWLRTRATLLREQDESGDLENANHFEKVADAMETLAQRWAASGVVEGFDQRQHDYDAMTAIASYLRDNPAPPLSGRQCEEFVHHARDALYGEKS